MLIMERLISPNSHSHSLDGVPAQKGLDGPSNIEFDAELGDLDQAGRATENTRTTKSSAMSFVVFLALIIHKDTRPSRLLQTPWA